ncbi:CTQ-dependent glycine oxidase GoxA [Azospirillum sp. SYSU D00513]|uniref:CTQ-dependent glycine oxidase GoxA n=1 Tax=Azospirillum sp. SYSU D00513 TaxID=2812561 RepID=UPI001A962163|nr:CTQ-dependent glycine oxidase GoxA [Azospirillum sp. SYSU D00513]
MAADNSNRPAGGIKRRDFLATAGLASMAMPLMARAAFAQNAPATPPADTAIARLAVYPPLGICRVGNSTNPKQGEGWFLAPEVPGLPALPNGDYKDGDQRIKKQVQRFRVYAFNKAGEVIREVTAAEARIEWTVHVANTKAAWYGFNNPLDNGEAAPGLPGQPRNQFVIGNDKRAEMLVIDPGPRSIVGIGENGDGASPAYDMVGRFWKKLDIKLGHLRTDDRGRLLVFPGDGVSQSAVPNNPISNFSDNDGWQDDWCDGVVQAKVTFTGGGPNLEVENGWVACCGPDFAPDIPPFISLYDVINDLNVEAGWTQPPQGKLSFQKYIYPLFHRLALMDWVAAASNLDQGWIRIGDFSDPAYMKRLADPSPANQTFREGVLAAIRDPNSEDQQQYKLPYMPGDGINYSASPLRWFKMPKAQYALLAAWAKGEFENDLTDGAPAVVDLDSIPLSERPEALTRAALEPCSGGAFHPGVELTWPLRHKELYRGPFRIALSTARDPSLIQDLGLLLTPEKAFQGHGKTPPAVAPQMPGDLTRWMGLPWQCDAFSCQQVVFSNDFPAATWWPALLPIDVLPQLYYDKLMDKDLAPAERLKFFESRVAWSRGVAGIGYHAEASYTDGLNQMIYLWDRMGFVVSRPGPTDAGRPEAIPGTLYVEVGRGSMDLFLDQPPNRGLTPLSPQQTQTSPAARNPT